MPQGLVVGIFPGTDPSEIERALTAQQIDLSKVKVVRRTDTPASGDSAIDFVDVFENMEHNSYSDDMTKGIGIMGDYGGTGVPGIGASGPSLGSFSSRGSGAKGYLSSLAIPYDEVDNFDQALERGRAVIAYPDPGSDASAVAAAFKAAGLKNVRTY